MKQSFVEIEHKFVVSNKFDLNKFRDVLKKQKPVKHYKVDVNDSYFILKNHSDYIFRHRRDPLIEQLTVKTLSKDPERRTEINLDLLQSKAGQSGSIEKFLEIFEIKWHDVIQKDVEVFYFKDCEIVFYKARSKTKSVSCVEFEARHMVDLPKARKILLKYEMLLGFNETQREKRSLPQLIFPKIFS